MVVQWLGLRVPGVGARVRSLVEELNPTCRTKTQSNQINFKKMETKRLHSWFVAVCFHKHFHGLRIFIG